MLIQFVLFAVLLGALIMTWRRAIQRVITPGEAALWSLLWIGASVIIWAPQTSNIIARFFGVGRGADLMLYGSVVLLFVLVFRVFVSLEELERKLTDIVRTQALKDLHPPSDPDRHD